MAKFIKNKKSPDAIWNGQKDKAIKFVDDVCITEDNFEIKVLTDNGYEQIFEKVLEKVSEGTNDVELPKKVLKKIVKPKNKGK